MRAVSELSRPELERYYSVLSRKMELMRAGADATPVKEDVMLTPGQWIHMFLEKSGPDRLLIVEAIFASLEVAKNCRFTHKAGD